MSTAETIVLAIFLVLPIVLIIGCVICVIYEGILSKHFEKKYPEVFKMIKEANDYGSEYCHYHNTNITPLENKIEYMLRESKYMTKSKREEMEIELEKMREEIEKHQKVCDEIQEKEDELKNQIETEIRKDEKFLKYMRGLGWCKED